MRRAVCFAMLLSPAGMNALADDWERWRDGRRVLLVCVASADDARWRQQIAALSANRKDLGDRAVAVVRWEGGGEPCEWPSAAKITSAEVLARRFPELKPSDWRVALIGRDGGVKASWNGVVPPGEIFARIDDMPMGRREKEARENKGP